MTYQSYPSGQYPPNSPQYGGQPPGYPAPGPSHGSPPQKKKLIWPWVLGGLLIVVLLLFSGCVFVVVRFIGSPFDVAVSYAIDLEEGDYSSAYDRLCAESKAEISFEEYETNYIPDSDIEVIDIGGSVSFNDGDDEVSDSFVGEFNYADGTSENLPHDLVKEEGSWKVCNPPIPAN